MPTQLEPIDLFLAIVAIVIFWKLRSVLGTRSDTNHDSQDSAPAPIKPNQEFGRQGDRKSPASFQPNGSRGDFSDHNLKDVKGYEFDEKEFMAGAKLAYEMVVEAFASGDLQTLQPLLTDDVFEQFESAIRQRNEDADVSSQRLVQIRNATIKEIEKTGTMMKVAVSFVSDFINIKKAKSTSDTDNVSEIVEISDIWIFQRDIRSVDPNWQISSTNPD